MSAIMGNGRSPAKLTMEVCHMPCSLGRVPHDDHHANLMRLHGGTSICGCGLHGPLNLSVCGIESPGSQEKCTSKASAFVLP